MSQEGNPPLMSNDEYAKQWIDYLTKRNNRLGLVWPILLTMVILLLIAVMYLFNQLNVIALKDSSAQQVVNKLESKLADSELSVASLNDKLLGLKQGREDLSETNKKLLAQVQLFEEDAGLKEQFISALQDKVVVLEAENKNHELAYNELKSSLSAKEQSKVRHISTLEQRFKKSTADLSRQLEARKVAYNALAERQKETKQEMNRLANELSDQMMEINVIVDDRDRYKKSFDIKDKENIDLQNRYKALEQKFKSMVAPISVNKAPATKATISPSSQAPVVVKDASSSKVASSPAKKANTQPSSFDYDSISIDKP